MKIARIASLCLALATPLAADEVATNGYVMKKYSSNDCTGTHEDIKSGTCQRLSTSLNITMKWGELDECKKGGEVKYETFQELDCAGSATAGKSKITTEVGECEKIDTGGSQMLTCGAYGTASLSALAVGAAILMSFF